MSARSSEFVMTPSVQKTVPGADGARIVPTVQPFLAQVVFSLSRFLPKSFSAQVVIRSSCIGPGRAEGPCAHACATGQSARTHHSGFALPPPVHPAGCPKVAVRGCAQ